MNGDKVRILHGYVTFGWCIFPLAPGSKVPVANSGGVYDATDDPATIRQWWSRNPRLNVGLACGPSGVVAIDLDRKDGRDGIRAWAALGLRSTTPTSRTPSGGLHLLFRAPDGIQIGNSSGKLGDGIDVRGQGGYIVIPPSALPGGAYRWLSPPDRYALAPLPQAVIDRLKSPERENRPDLPPVSPANGTAYARAALGGELGSLARARDGSRNDTLNRAAFNLGQLAGAGLLDRGDLERRLLQVALGIGLGEREAVATIASGLSAGEANPRMTRTR